jgi:hypothetical protein
MAKDVVMPMVKKNCALYSVQTSTRQKLAEPIMSMVLALMVFDAPLSIIQMRLMQQRIISSGRAHHLLRLLQQQALLHHAH